MNPRHENVGDSIMKNASHSPEDSPRNSNTLGAGAAAAPSTSALRPLLLRTAIGAIAILGLSGIGAFSMVAGVEGAHASPKEASSVWLSASNNEPQLSPSSIPPVESAQVNTATTPAEPAAITDVAGCPTRTEDGKVIVNRAKVEDLRKIPGIGPKRAEAILALRAKLKQFKRPAELLRVKGIGPKSLVKMQPYFVLNDPKGNDCEKAPPPAPPITTASPPK
jgi:competence protein ComEA